MKNACLVTIALVMLGAVSCQKGTYLKLEFKGQGLPDIYRIDLTITRNVDGWYSAGGMLPPGNATTPIHLPVSVALNLEGSTGALTIGADAVDRNGGLVKHGATTTTVMPGKTWTEVIDLSLDPTSTDAGTDADATTVDDAAGPVDASDDVRALFKITDGSVTDGTGCVAATVQASESVSVDYNSAGQNQEAGNMLWATGGQQERFIGWAKFGLRFIPNNASGFKIMKATLNLSLSQVAGAPAPQLQVVYSKNDGWIRKAMPDMLAVDDKISEISLLPPSPLPAVYAYALNVATHDWASDIVDGTITLGIQNVTPLSVATPSSRAEFFGVTAPPATDTTRPTLDLEFCR